MPAQTLESMLTIPFPPHLHPLAILVIPGGGQIGMFLFLTGTEMWEAEAGGSPAKASLRGGIRPCLKNQKNKNNRNLKDNITLHSNNLDS